MSDPEGEAVARAAGHSRALVEIAAISAIGILATAGFQVVAARGLGAADFGLLAAFLAVINVVAVGSAALRSSVAVATASGSEASLRPRGRLDGPAIEALTLGGIGTAAVLAAGPLFVSTLGADWWLVVLTALAIIPYFLFARAQGMLQGAGATRSVVWWTTGSQVLQVALTALAVVLVQDALGVLVAVLATAVAGTVGSTVQSGRLGIAGQASPFTARSVVVLLLTVSFAWTTNADVVLVRANTPASESGAYAAAAVFAKTLLIVPSILSLYLLPRFVRSGSDPARTRLGLNLTLLLTLVSGAAIVLGLWLLSSPIVQLLYGPDYTRTIELLPWLALMCLPWALAQATLISVTARVSRVGLAVALAAGVLQLICFGLALPNLALAIALNGLVGIIMLGGMYLAHLGVTRSSRDR